MMKFSDLAAALLLVIIATFGGPPLSLALQSSESKASWERVISDNSRDYELRLAAVGADGRSWVIVGERPKGQRQPSQQFALWGVDGRGRLGARTDLDRALTQGQTGVSGASIQALAAWRDTIALIAQMPPNKTLLLFLDANSIRVLNQKQIPSPEGLLITKILHSAEGGLLILGTVGANGWVATTDQAGAILWQKTLSSSTVSSIGDAAQLSDGSFVLLGSVSGRTSASPSGSWIGKISQQGNIVAQEDLKFTAVGVTGFRDGQLAVLEERYGTSGKDVSARLLDANLKERRNVVLLTSIKGAFPFRISRFGNDAIVLGYTNTHLPWFAQVTPEAKLAWTETRAYEAKQVPVVGRLDVMTDTIGAIAFFTLAVVDERGEQRQTVRVIKYEAP